jgi:hypothetical protein
VEIPELAAAVWDGTSLAQIETLARAGGRLPRGPVAELEGRIVGTVSVRPRRPANVNLFALDVGLSGATAASAAACQYVVELARSRG